MKQTEKIEMFLNWLMDNNHYTKYIGWFKDGFNITSNTFNSLKKELNETNYVDFINMVKGGIPTGGDVFNYDVMELEWKEYISKNNIEDIYFEKGEYVRYTVKRNGVKSNYISLIDRCEDDFISEYCCAIMSSTDEDIEGHISYYEKCDIDECFSNFRLATEAEIKWFKEHVYSADGVNLDAYDFNNI